MYEREFARSFILQQILYLQVQCNVFKGASGEVGLTCGGGLRQLPGLNETFENAALVWTHSKCEV